MLFVHDRNISLTTRVRFRLLGTSLKLHPIVVLLSTVAGGVEAGMVGLILAAPLTSIGINLFSEPKSSGFLGDATIGHRRGVDSSRGHGSELMADIEKIQDAEAKVAAMQDALAGVQSGLQRAEQVAVAAEQAKAKAEQAVKLTLVLVALSVVLVGLSLRRRNR